MGLEHVNGDQGLGRGWGWGLLFNLKILLAKESSYEFSTFVFPTSLLWPHSAQVHVPWEIAFCSNFCFWFYLVTHAGFEML